MNINLYFNHIKLAIRILIRNRIYTLINIFGLSLGLCIFLFASILVQYELHHDDMFENQSKIVTVGSIFSKTNNEGIKEYPNIRLAYGPIFEKELPEVKSIARAVHQVNVVKSAQRLSFQNIRYVDSDFLRIFEFTTIQGSLDSWPYKEGVIITRSMAKVLFARNNKFLLEDISPEGVSPEKINFVIGQKITIDHKVELPIIAVIDDLSNKSHFNSSYLPNNQLGIIAPIATLKELGKDTNKDWHSFDPHDMTYMLLPRDKTLNWLQKEIDRIVAQYASKTELRYVSQLKVRPLSEANTQIWDAFGFPIITFLQTIGVLILIISCLNYTNLATAQSLNRKREVELRVALGAKPYQIIIQFLIESFFLILGATVIALAALEVIIPIFNTLTTKELSLNYQVMLPWYLGATFITALFSGCYPAWIASQAHITSDWCLSSNKQNTQVGKVDKGTNSSSISRALISIQLSISILILSIVLVVHFQNKKMESLSASFLESPTLILSGVDNTLHNNTETDVVLNHNETLNQERRNALREALLAIKQVESVSFSTGIPFAESGEVIRVLDPSKSTGEYFSLNLEAVDSDFIQLYGINLLQSTANELVEMKSETSFRNAMHQEIEFQRVIINQTAALKLGFMPDEDVVGKHFAQANEDSGQLNGHYMIVGLIEDQYFYGAHSNIPPMALVVSPRPYRLASVRLTNDYDVSTLGQIDAAWNKIYTLYPVRRELLSFYFELFFRFPKGVNLILAGLSVVALALALFGMFGLSMLMTLRRSKEIALRKVHGAHSIQIIKLLVWQYLQPVIWSLIFAIPFAYFLSQKYLAFFPERISYALPLIILASLSSLFLVALVIASQVRHIATKTPIDTLRYE